MQYYIRHGGWVWGVGFRDSLIVSGLMVRGVGGFRDSRVEILLGSLCVVCVLNVYLNKVDMSVNTIPPPTF